MAETLSSIVLSMTLKATQVLSLDGATKSAAAALGDAITKALTTGTGPNQADKIWADAARTINSGSSEDIDLYDLAAFDIGAGAGKGPMGQAIALAEVVALLVYVDPVSTGKLWIGGKNTAAAWQSAFHLDGVADDGAGVGPFGPGGGCLLFEPNDPAFLVADTSNHLLKMRATGGNVTYYPIVLGRSA